MERNSSIISYLVGVLMMWASRHTVQDIAFIVGVLVAVATLATNFANFFVNWYYRRKTWLLLQQRQAHRKNDEFHC